MAASIRTQKLQIGRPVVRAHHLPILIEKKFPGRNRSQAETQRRTMQVLTNADDDEEGWEDEATLNERRLLSRYGVWLLVRDRVGHLIIEPF